MEKAERDLRRRDEAVRRMLNEGNRLRVGGGSGEGFCSWENFILPPNFHSFSKYSIFHIVVKVGLVYKFILKHYIYIILNLFNLKQKFYI